MGSLGSRAKTAVPALIGLLEDPVPRVRRMAARTLVRVASNGDSARKALPVLLEALHDPDEDVRADAAWLLGSLLRPEDKEAVAPLGQALRDRSLRVRGEVVELLERFGPAAEETVPALIEMLKEKPIRPRVIETLGRIGPGAKDAVPAPIEAMREEGPAVDIEERVEISPGYGTAAIHESVRLRAVIALGQIGPGAKDALPALVEAYSEKNEFFRDHVAKAIKAIDPETAKKLQR
jgi:HEAT repeat protein